MTGVSGSGKSSLVFDVLDRAIRKHLNGSGDAPGEHDRIEGYEHLDKIITIDQEHIGRIPRSNAATYSDTFTPIREAFAATPEARRLKYSARHFSFNVPGGRCERCQGAGVLTVQMHFMPAVEVRCPVCHGRRFKRETLTVRYRDHDISQVLDMTVEEALALFQDVPAARSRLQVLSDVGLGYLQLGQPATTLSGGEAQRVKLAKELGTPRHRSHTVSARRTDDWLAPGGYRPFAGRTPAPCGCRQHVIVVEHNLDLIKAADWVIDLGPEGGAAGGKLIAEGTPEQIAQVCQFVHRSVFETERENIKQSPPESLEKLRRALTLSLKTSRILSHPLLDLFLDQIPYFAKLDNLFFFGAFKARRVFK